MDLNQLRYFKEIIDCKSISKAAKQLYLSQPALSKSISKLENELGVALINRSDNGVTLTDAGKLLYVWSERILYDVSEFYKEFNQGYTERHLNIITTDELFEIFVLPLCISELSDIAFETHVVDSDLINKMIYNNNVDIAITNKDMTNDSLRSIFLLSNDLYILIPRSDPLSTKETVDFRDLSEKPFIRFNSNTVQHQVFEQYLAKSDIKINVSYKGNEVSWFQLQQSSSDYFFFLSSCRLLKNDIYPYHRIVKLNEDSLNTKLYLTFKRNTSNLSIVKLLKALRAAFLRLQRTNYYCKNHMLNISNTNL